MDILEIVIIVISLLIVVGVIGNYIYRKIKKLPTGDCACCSHTKNNGKSLVSQYHKVYDKTKECECSKKKK